MNMHAAPQRTAAETALIDGFAARFSDLPGDAAIALRRDEAVEQLKAGLPTRRIEAWHYTDLRRLLARVPDFDPTAQVADIAPLLEGSTVLSLRNGRATADTTKREKLEVRPLEEMLIDGSFSRALEPRGSDDTIGAVNAAFVTDGWFLDVEPGAEIAAPVEVQNLHGGGQVHVRLPVRVGAGAKLSVIERQTGRGTALVSSVSHLAVGDGAEVNWIIVQEQPDDATHLGQFNATLGKDARLRLFVMNAGGRLVRQEVLVTANGDGADFQLRAINLLAGDAINDLTMQLDHAAPHTTSTELVRNILTDRSRGVFQGQIRVAREAQKTDAKMACNTLLLSDEAEFATKPELEIFADDVACGHGATVTEIDRGHLFYLMARGVTEKEARGLLVKAFLAAVIEELNDEPLVEALEAKLDAWFSKHG
jgi:Fe-S cluster assembly protein SufD